MMKTTMTMMAAMRAPETPPIIGPRGDPESLEPPEDGFEVGDAVVETVLPTVEKQTKQLYHP